MARLTFSPPHTLPPTAVLPLQNYHSTQISMSRHCLESGNPLACDRPASGAKRDLNPPGKPRSPNRTVGASLWGHDNDVLVLARLKRKTARFVQERPHFGRNTILNVAPEQARGSCRQIAHFACLLGL